MPHHPPLAEKADQHFGRVCGADRYGHAATVTARHIVHVLVDL
jgi:hypothetical protein